MGVAVLSSLQQMLFESIYGGFVWLLAGWLVWFGWFGLVWLVCAFRFFFSFKTHLCADSQISVEGLYSDQERNWIVLRKFPLKMQTDAHTIAFEDDPGRRVDLKMSFSIAETYLFGFANPCVDFLGAVDICCYIVARVNKYPQSSCHLSLSGG